jgi:hypothetical protein
LWGDHVPSAAVGLGVGLGVAVGCGDAVGEGIGATVGASDVRTAVGWGFGASRRRLGLGDGVAVGVETVIGVGVDVGGVVATGGLAGWPAAGVALNSGPRPPTTARYVPTAPHSTVAAMPAAARRSARGSMSADGSGSRRTVRTTAMTKRAAARAALIGARRTVDA